MRIPTLRIFLSVSAVCLIALLSATGSQARQWQVGLIKMEAEVVAYDGKKVKLKNEKYTVPIDVARLSDADKQYLDQTYPNGLKEVVPDKPADSPPAGAPNNPPAGPPAGSPPGPPAGAPGANPGPPADAPRTAARPVTRPMPRRPAAGRGAPPAAATGGMTVEVVSLTVTKPAPDGAGDGFVTPGTQLRLLVSDPARTITGLDPGKSKVTECIDDKRTNLMAGADGFAAPEELMLQVGPDGKSGTIDLVHPQVPSPQSTRIRLRGELHVMCEANGASETVRVPLNIILGIGL